MKNQKKTPFQVQMQRSFSLNNFGVCLSVQFWRWCLRCCSVVVSSKGTHKVEQKCTHTKTNKQTNKQKPHKLSQVHMQYSFSKFFSMQV
jgi:hypothetical protein